MNGNGYDDSRLAAARHADAELRRMQRSAAELPELEKAEAERQRWQAAQQQAERAEVDLEPMAKDYRLSLEKSNLEIAELIRHFADIIQRRKAIDAKGREVERLAGQVAQARIELGQAPGGGSWGTSHNANLELLKATTEQVLIELNARPGQIRLGDKSELAALVLDLLSRFCDVRQAAEPRSLLSGKVMLVDHHGNSYWG